jgi:hypothetical protein
MMKCKRFFPLLVAWLFAVILSSSFAQTPVADYNFQNNLLSSVGSAPALVNLGTGNAYEQDTVDGIVASVLGFPAGNGVALANASTVFPDSIYTIVAFFRFQTISSWRRILDFKSRTTDNGLYSYYAQLQFYGPGVTGTDASIKAGSFIQVVLTRDAAKNVVGYVNGSQQISFVDNSGEAVVNAADTLSFFRDDLRVPNENSAGSVARITIYNQALTPAQVGLLSRLANSGLQKPVITSPLISPATVSTPFTYQITATNSPAFFTATGLPVWAILNNTTGVVTGTPSVDGVSRVSIGAINAAGAGTADLIITVAPAAGTIVAFNQPAFSVNEGDGTATVWVRRLGAAAAFSVNYATASGTATTGADFQTAAGTLDFAATDSLKSFSVTIENDTVMESTEQLTLSLSNPTNGVTIATPSTATLSIFDNNVHASVRPDGKSFGPVGKPAFSIIGWSGRAASWVQVNYVVGNSSNVKIALYDSRGTLRADFIDGPRSTGVHVEKLFVPALPAGVYEMRLSGIPGALSKRIMVMR